MTTPDFTPYIDLTPLDQDPAAIYLGAIELARLTMPEFTLRQGTPEDAIFQAMAYISSISVGAINRLPPRLMIGLANLLGIQRYEGTKATVEATITLNDYASSTISAGTIFSWKYESETGDTLQFAFELVEDLFINAGTPPTLPSGTGLLRALTAGVLPVLTVGTSLVVLTTDSDIETAITTDSFVNGEEPDDDGEYLDAVTTYMRSLSSSVATAAQAQATVLANYRDVARCKVFDLTNPSGSLLLSAPDEPGFSTVFVYGKGRQLTPAERAVIQLGLESKLLSGIVQDVLQFSIAGLSLRVDVVFDDRYEQQSVNDLIVLALNDYLSPSYFPLYEPSIRSTSILARLMQIDGVLYVNSVDLQPIGELFTEKQWSDVRVATTAPITISTALNAGDTLDGVTLVAGDRVLVKNQSAGAENGIYVVGPSPTRATDADLAGEFVTNKLIYVTSGSTNADSYWKLTTSGTITLGTTALTFAAGTPFNQLTFLYKGTLPDVSLGSITVTIAGETII